MPKLPAFDVTARIPIERREAFAAFLRHQYFRKRTANGADDLAVVGVHVNRDKPVKAAGNAKAEAGNFSAKLFDLIRGKSGRSQAVPFVENRPFFADFDRHRRIIALKHERGELRKGSKRYHDTTSLMRSRLRYPTSGRATSPPLILALCVLIGWFSNN